MVSQTVYRGNKENDSQVIGTAKEVSDYKMGLGSVEIVDTTYKGNNESSKIHDPQASEI